MSDWYPLDDSQWKAVRAADRHVLVAAGAGTGKTRTVVGRMLYLLGMELRGERIATPLSLDDISAITFTNAAAADLKTKIRLALREAGRRDLAAEVDTARIGTIHGFCGDLLREFALRANRSPGTRVLVEGESEVLLDEAVRDAVIAAIEDSTVPGLDLLLGEQSLSTVQGWVYQLLGDSDRLRGYAERAEAHGARERALLALARRALARHEERLAEDGATDFDRMLVAARDLLRLPAVRMVVQRRIHTLIVDEFQDVDPVQKEIAFLLGEPATGRTDTTRLLLVGDPKQSIYRFRRADVTVWTSVEREFRDAARGRVVPLEVNYRSVEPLVQFVESVVGPILDTPLAGSVAADYEVSFQPTTAKRRREEPADRAVELLLLRDDDGEKLGADERRRREAAAIATRMLALRKDGHRWGDMAVLLGAWRSVAVYESALGAAGIPTYTLAQSGFYKRQEVVDILVALEAIRDPHDDVALVGFLRSPFVGVRDETLLQIARKGTPPYWEGIDAARTGEPELVARGVALIQELARLRDRISTAELIERLLALSGYLGHLALLDVDGPQRIANVRKLLRMARGMAAVGVGEFIVMLREARARDDREGDARLYGESDDVVTLTSIHSAKGLEWRVVFWADLARKPQPDRNDGMLLGRDRLVIEDPEVEESPEWKAATLAARLEEQAERKRVWYVAATRAKDRLILSGIPLPGKLPTGGPAESLWRQLEPLMAADGASFGYGAGKRRFTGVVQDIPALPDGDGLARVRPIADDATLALPLPPIVAPVGRLRHSATEFLARARCGVKHHFKYVAGVREPEIDRNSAGYTGAVVRGQIVHSVLEVLAEESELDRLLDDAIRRWDPEAPPPGTEEGKEYREELRREVEQVKDHPAYRAVANHPEAERELRFVHLAGGAGFTEGVFDLIAPEGSGMVVLDVKTSGIAAEAAAARAAHYAPQRDVYVTAAEAIAGRSVERFAFQFSSAGVQVSEPITPALRAEAGARTGAVMASIGSGRPAMTRFPAECRYCGYRNAGWCAGVTGGDEE